MSSRTGPEDQEFTFKFGGGLNTRTPEDSITPGEAAGGRNFLIDVASSDLKPRPPIDLVTTAPNGAAIRGGGSMRKSDGTVIAFFQAGDTVYEYDSSGLVGSPVLDTVSSNAKLRGHWRSHAWTIEDELIITDLSLSEPVMEWDGTTWGDVAFLSNPSTSFGSLGAKHCYITSERAVFANVKDNGTEFNHVIVGSERGDFRTVSSSDRPASSLGEADAWFLVTPDLRPVNGIQNAYGVTVFSSSLGRMFRLDGDTAQDFKIKEFYPNSYATGDESVAYVGNDIVYGRQGRIESLIATENFGDTQADDLSLKIQDIVKGYENWTIVYNGRLNRAYCFPEGQSECWVFDTAFSTEGVSPWMRWRTTLTMAMQPTFVASMLDPADGLEYVFLGDGNGNIFRMEGTGTSGDGGTNDINTIWESPLLSLNTQQRVFDVHGYVRYRKSSEIDLTITCLYAGDNIFDEQVSLSLPATPSGRYYGGGKYYKNNEYYGTRFTKRLARKDFEMPGADSTDFQIRVSITSPNDFEISEIGLRFSGSE